jgi:hypothetical protein
MTAPIHQEQYKMNVKERMRVRGIFRLQLEKDGMITGDSGWCDNAFTNEGKKEFVLGCFAGLAGSSQVSHVAVGTGTAPGAAATSLDGEMNHGAGSRKAVSASSNASTRADFFATFASSDSHNTAALNISNIGLFGVSNVAAGSIMAGNTYTSSTWATNQNLNVTYGITVS